MAGVRLIASAGLPARERTAIRALLDAAFAGDFSDDDWAHALGGTHAIIEADRRVVAHGAVMPRILEIGSQPIEVGYVEAVAVLPEKQGTGLGTAVMEAVAEVLRQDFDLGVLSTGEWHFYERLGWERWRGPTWVRHPDGRMERSADDDDSLMILRQGSTTSIDLTAPITCDARPGDAW